MSSIKYRHLGRDSAHRQALLRNLVTSLIEKESISTTWAKAKEAQRLAEKLITLGKKNTNASKQKAQTIFYVCRTCFQFGPLFCAIAKCSPVCSAGLYYELVGKMDLKLIGIRNHTSICPNYSGPSVNVTSTDPEVTLGSCASSL
jgi:ribosomal protein L17